VPESLLESFDLPREANDD